MNEKLLRVLVVDDSVVFRTLVRNLLDDCPDIEVVGVAANGRIAMDKIQILKPDLVTLDVEMPVLDGLGVLTAIRQRQIDVGVIMLSALTNAGARLTTSALKLGAFDFVLKPQGNDLEENIATLRRQLVPKITACGRRREKTALRRQSAGQPSSPAQPVSRQTATETGEIRRPAQAAQGAATSSTTTRVSPNTVLNVVAIGISTGGPAALAEAFPKLSADFPVPLLVVQHMPPMFTASLAADLDRSCSLNVCEAKDGQRIEAGTVYFAPGGRHMKAEQGDNQVVARITDDPRERSCRPSVDFLFRSVAEVWGKNALGVVMTGMGDDGKEGCAALRHHGARIVAQDEESCVIYGMPRAVVEAGLADTICCLDQIPGVLNRAVAKGRLVCS